ncbi:hypothetical protein Tco_0290524 [Tanacetum coccineum]
MQLTHLSFADDLLVLCHGDEVSVNVIKDALLEFSNCSGLKPNMEKSVVFFGSNPASRIANSTEWKKEVKTVLSNMQTYWAAVLKIPKTVIKEIDSILKKFLWGNGVKGQYGSNLKGKSFWVIEEEPGDSDAWKALLDLRNKIRPYIIHKVGNGKIISMWNDNWSNQGFLKQFVTDRDIHDARISENCCVADLIENGKWSWPESWSMRFNQIRHLQVPDINNNKEDQVKWKGKGYGSIVVFSLKMFGGI